MMAPVRHVLAGLRPQPLASYLAGLGLARVLSEQADPDLTVAWDDEGLILDTGVSEIAPWLVDQYVPTPILSPWNEGSGFGAKDKVPKEKLAQLCDNDAPRFAPFRTALAVGDEVAKRSRAEGWTKERAVQELRNRCPESMLPWIDATVVLANAQAVFPPLLGTGGNDGRLEFSTNFHQRLLEVIDTSPAARERSRALATDFLSGEHTERKSVAAVGQFDPAGAGGPNSSAFGASDSLVNPWGFVLLVEGALLFASAAVRRHQHAAGQAAIPFTVFASPDASPSGSIGEKSRGEVWVPVWRKPFSLAEVRQLFADARATWRGRPARQAVEFYAATRTLGVSRGVDSFVRYGLHQRNGQAFVAVPIERVAIRHRPAVELAAPLEDWVGRARRSKIGTAAEQRVRRFDTTHMAFVRTPTAHALGRMLAALTDLELAVGRSGRGKDAVTVRQPPNAANFLGPLQEGTSAELRVAVGLASCVALGAGGSTRTMRQLLLPIDPSWPRQTWRETPVVAGLGIRTLRAVLADVLVWRARTAADELANDNHRVRGIPTFRRGIRVPHADLHAFATPGMFDEALLDMWFRACLALDWRGVDHAWSVPQPSSTVPNVALGVLHPFAAGMALGGVEDAPELGLDPDWPTRLAAGRLHGVHNDAVRRLRQVGWLAGAYIGGAKNERDLGLHVAAALVPRCDKPTAVLSRHLATRIHASSDEPNHLSQREKT